MQLFLLVSLRWRSDGILITLTWLNDFTNDSTKIFIFDSDAKDNPAKVKANIAPENIPSFISSMVNQYGVEKIMVSQPHLTAYSESINQILREKYAKIDAVPMEVLGE